MCSPDHDTNMCWLKVSFSKPWKLTFLINFLLFFQISRQTFHKILKCSCGDSRSFSQESISKAWYECQAELAFQVISQMFNGVDVICLCRLLNFFHNMFFIYAHVHVFHLVAGKGNLNATAHKDILDNCVFLTLRQMCTEGLLPKHG